MRGGCLSWMAPQLLKEGALDCEVFHQGNGPEGALCDRRAADCIGHRQNLLLELRREAQQAQHLADPNAADPFLPGDIGLALRLTGVEQRTPLKSLSEELNR